MPGGGGPAKAPFQNSSHLIKIKEYLTHLSSQEGAFQGDLEGAFRDVVASQEEACHAPSFVRAFLEEASLQHVTEH